MDSITKINKIVEEKFIYTDEFVEEESVILTINKKCQKLGTIME
jgi:hypothetical protein